MIVEVLVIVNLGKLITNSEKELREENLSLELKTIMSGHIVKVGVIVSSNLQFMSKQNHEVDIFKKIKSKDRIVELKKDIMFEKDYKQECIVVLVTLAEIDHVDNSLQKIQ